MKTNLLIVFMTLASRSSANDLKGSIQESGLFWVVIGVLTIVLLGIFVYLFRLEKKLKKLEDQ